MHGTEKQIKWAEDIKALVGFEKALRPEMKELFEAELAKRSDAGWWIDRRFELCGPRELMSVIGREMQEGK